VTLRETQPALSPEAPAPQPSTARRRTVTLLKAVCSVALLALVLRGLDTGKLQDILKTANLWYVALAALIVAPMPFVNLPRWQALLEWLGYSLPRAALTRALFIGSFFNQVLPSSVGGDAWRIWFCMRAGVPFGVATSTILIERLAGLAVIFILFGVVFVELLGRVGADPVRWVLWAMLAGCFGVGIAIALLRAGVAERLRSIRLLRPLADFGRTLAIVTATGRRSALLFVTALVGQFIGITALWAVSLGLDTSLTFVDCAVVFSPMVIAALVPITLGGWGLREGALVVLLRFYGVSGEQALLLSLLFSFALLVGTLPGLAVWLASSPVPPRQDKAPKTG
jgi:uncharacterized membrane protein YbhN (UPF0104 family)